MLIDWVGGGNKRASLCWAGKPWIWNVEHLLASRGRFCGSGFESGPDIQNFQMRSAVTRCSIRLFSSSVSGSS